LNCVSPSSFIERYGLDYLRGASTLGALSEEALSYLIERGELFEMMPGETLFNIDDPVDCFYVILDGGIAFYKPSKEGRTHIRDYNFGMELGFVAMIGLHNRVGDAEAAKPTLILKVTCDLFNDLHQDLPNDFGILLLNLSREMSRRLRDADERLANAE